MDEDVDFDIEEINKIIRETIDKVIGPEGIFKVEKIKKWTDSIVESCLEEFTKLKKPFKYIVTCMINQKDGAGLHSHSSCFFNTDTDGVVTVRWENNTMYTFVTTFGLAIF